MKYLLIAILLIGCKSNATLVRYADRASFDVFCVQQQECMDRIRQTCMPHYFKIESQSPALPAGFAVTASCLDNSTVE